MSAVTGLDLLLWRGGIQVLEYFFIRKYRNKHLKKSRLKNYLFQLICHFFFFNFINFKSIKSSFWNVSLILSVCNSVHLYKCGNLINDERKTMSENLSIAIFCPKSEHVSRRKTFQTVYYTFVKTNFTEVLNAVQFLFW